MNRLISVSIMLTLIGYVYSYQIIKSAEYLGKGFDAKTGEINVFPIFQYHYNYNQSWSPQGSSIKYDVPDEFNMRELSIVKDNSILSSYETYDSYLSDYLSWNTFEFGIQTGTFSLAYDHIKELEEIYQSITTDISMFSHSNYWWGFYQANLMPFNIMEKDPYFVKTINMIPRTINTQSDIELYTELISTYGTDVLIKSIFGAKISVNNFIDNEITHSQSFEWIMEQTSLTFHFWLFDVSPGDFKHKSDIKIDDLFLKHSRTIIDFDGGDPILGNNATFDQWLNTIEDQPTYLNSTFIPLWKLITDDSIKQATLKDFIEKYISGKTQDILKYRVKEPNNNPIPGIDMLGHGFDTTTMESKDPVYWWTYDMGTTWTNPIYPNLVFDVPSQ
jgi:hypothetical protein